MSFQDSFDNVIDQIIREAQAKGKFDNLRNTGKRLDLTPKPGVAPAMQAFNNILNEANYAPEWVNLSQTIEKSYKALCQQFSRTRDWATAELEALRGQQSPAAQHQRDFVYDERRRARERFADGLTELNHKIAELNFVVPHPHFQRFKFDLETELKRLD